MDVIMTTPNVTYEAIARDGTVSPISAAEDFPSGAALAKIKEFREPFVRATIIAPVSTFGTISELCSVPASPDRPEPSSSLIPLV